MLTFYDISIFIKHSCKKQGENNRKQAADANTTVLESSPLRNY